MMLHEIKPIPFDFELEHEEPETTFDETRGETNVTEEIWRCGNEEPMEISDDDENICALLTFSMSQSFDDSTDEEDDSLYFVISSDQASDQIEYQRFSTNAPETTRTEPQTQEETFVITPKLRRHTRSNCQNK